MGEKGMGEKEIFERELNESFVGQKSEDGEVESQGMYSSTCPLLEGEDDFDSPLPSCLYIAGRDRKIFLCPHFRGFKLPIEDAPPIINCSYRGINDES